MAAAPGEALISRAGCFPEHWGNKEVSDIGAPGWGLVPKHFGPAVPLQKQWLVICGKLPNLGWLSMLEAHQPAHLGSPVSWV